MPEGWPPGPPDEESHPSRHERTPLRRAQVDPHGDELELAELSTRRHSSSFSELPLRDRCRVEPEAGSVDAPVEAATYAKPPVDVLVATARQRRWRCVAYGACLLALLCFLLGGGVGCAGAYALLLTAPTMVPVGSMGTVVAPLAHAVATPLPPPLAPPPSPLSVVVDAAALCEEHDREAVCELYQTLDSARARCSELEDCVVHGVGPAMQKVRWRLRNSEPTTDGGDAEHVDDKLTVVDLPPFVNGGIEWYAAQTASTLPPVVQMPEVVEAGALDALAEPHDASAVSFTPPLGSFGSAEQLREAASFAPPLWTACECVPSHDIPR